jgi:1,4-dihydroxy-2-naphthoyl-CoA synthase
VTTLSFDRQTNPAQRERRSVADLAALLKPSFNGEIEHLAATEQLGCAGLHLLAGSEQAREGVPAFREKRLRDFSRFRARVSG